MWSPEFGFAGAARRSTVRPSTAGASGQVKSRNEASRCGGELAPGRDCFDAFRATFPAGTLTGAPKIRAMEIIEELEPVRRGVYGGAVGYFAFSGAMDTAITIRTVLVKGGRVYIQAGAGIVADSDPEAEHRECVNKARAMIQAVRLAEQL